MQGSLDKNTLVLIFSKVGWRWIHLSIQNTLPKAEEGRTRSAAEREREREVGTEKQVRIQLQAEVCVLSLKCTHKKQHKKSRREETRLKRCKPGFLFMYKRWEIRNIKKVEQEVEGFNFDGVHCNRSQCTHPSEWERERTETGFIRPIPVMALQQELRR